MRNQVVFTILEPEVVDEIKRLQVETNQSFNDLMKMLISTYRTVVRDKEVEVI